MEERNKEKPETNVFFPLSQEKGSFFGVELEKMGKKYEKQIAVVVYFLAQKRDCKKTSGSVQIPGGLGTHDHFRKVRRFNYIAEKKTS